MFANGVGGAPVFVGRPNPNIIPHPDPLNPVVTDPRDVDNAKDFMRLLIEQLRNQNPMSPLKSNEFTSQLAQMNSLQQLILLNESMSQQLSSRKLADATALIGRWVEGLDANNNLIAGYVERLEVIEGEVILKIGDKLLLPGQIVYVSSEPPEAGEEQE